MEPIGTLRQRRLPILSLLLALDAFVLGGFVALSLVNRLLGKQLNIYAPYSMADASTILDFMDDLFPYYVVCGGILLVLVLITFNAWAWLMTESRLLRCVGALLVLILVVVAAWTLLSRYAGAPPVPPMTPTPVARAPVPATLPSWSVTGLPHERWLSLGMEM